MIFQKEKIIGYIVLIIWIIGLIHAVWAYIKFVKILPDIPYEQRFNLKYAKKKYIHSFKVYLIYFIKPFIILLIYIAVSIGFILLMSVMK